jgi:hypothetical protein
MTPERPTNRDISRRAFVGSVAAAGAGAALPVSRAAEGSPSIGNVPADADWNSVALFFNLSGSNKPSGYSDTGVADTKEWLDEGSGPTSPPISEYVQDY